MINRVLQLYRSSTLYESLEDAMDAAKAVDFIAQRKDGEMALIRYTDTNGKTRTLLALYHRKGIIENIDGGVSFFVNVDEISTGGGGGGGSLDMVTASDNSMEVGSVVNGEQPINVKIDDSSLIEVGENGLAIKGTIPCGDYAVQPVNEPSNLDDEEPQNEIGD